VVSRLAKKRTVDHTRYDTTSILRLIETRWNLQPLGAGDRNARDLRNAFAF
jgi:phospholipase C